MDGRPQDSNDAGRFNLLLVRLGDCLLGPGIVRPPAIAPMVGLLGAMSAIDKTAPPAECSPSIPPLPGGEEGVPVSREGDMESSALRIRAAMPVTFQPPVFWTPRRQWLVVMLLGLLFLGFWMMRWAGARQRAAPVVLRSAEVAAISPALGAVEAPAPGSSIVFGRVSPGWLSMQGGARVQEASRIASELQEREVYEGYFFDSSGHLRLQIVGGQVARVR